MHSSFISKQFFYVHNPKMDTKVLHWYIFPLYAQTSPYTYIPDVIGVYTTKAPKMSTY